MLIFTTPIYRTHLHMHGAHNTCRNADILSANIEQIELQAKLLNYFLGSNKSNINAHALVHARLCNGAEASLP